MKNPKIVLGLVIASLMSCLISCTKSENSSASPVAQVDAAKRVEPGSVVETKLAKQAAPAAEVTNTAAVLISNSPTNLAASPADAKSGATATPSATVLAPTTIPVVDAIADSAQPNLATLSQNQVVRGLQEALAKGLQTAVDRLGHEGGFLTNLNVKIPMPEKLQKVESALRAMNQDRIVDNFVVTMNHAAEQAVPEAATVFTDALKRMTIADAQSILTGPSDAATQYFQKATQTNLYTRFYPIVQKATRQNGVTAAYEDLMQKGNLGGLSQKLGSFGTALGTSVFDKNSLDLDGYVTTKAMEGLFKMVAEEEKQIRQNPVARTTDLLQKVFGALKH